ncbi:hypothetical protein N2152v2_002159 [Parachlorella kessleri]
MGDVGKKRAPSKKNVAHDEYFTPEPDTTFYLSEKSRWKSDFLKEEAQRRTEEKRRKEEALCKKRAELGRREAEKQQREDEHFREEQQKVTYLQQSGARGRSNKSTAAFDIVTLKCCPTPEGKQLQQQVDCNGYCAGQLLNLWDDFEQHLCLKLILDDLRQKKAQQRSQRLWELNNTPTHNIITGGPPQAFPTVRPPA